MKEIKKTEEGKIILKWTRKIKHSAHSLENIKKKSRKILRKERAETIKTNQKKIEKCQHKIIKKKNKDKQILMLFHWCPQFCSSIQVGALICAGQCRQN